MKNQKKQPQILAISEPLPTVENKLINEKRTKWVPFFKDTNNTYINDLAVRYMRTATLQSIVNSKVNYSIGKEFSFTRNNEYIEENSLDSNFLEFLESSNIDREDAREVLKDVFFNWIAFGNVYVHIQVSESGNQKSRNFYSLDATKCRVDESGTMCFVSAYWRDIHNCLLQMKAV